MTAGATTKSNGKKFHYYFPTKGKGQNINVKIAHETINNLLDGLTINESLYPIIQKKVKKISEKARYEKKTKRTKIENEIFQREENAKNIKDMMLAAEITIDEYRDFKAHNEAIINELHQKLNEVEKIVELQGDVVAKILELFNKGIGRLFRKLKAPQKGIVLKTLMPDGFIIPKKGVVSTTYFEKTIL